MSVPMIGPRERYNVLTSTHTWNIHVMEALSTFDGDFPSTALLAKDKIDPVVSAGMAKWSDLMTGGFFDMLGNHKTSIRVVAVLNTNNVTLNITDKDKNFIRLAPATLPFVVAPGEYIQAVGGPCGSTVGILAKTDLETLV